MTAREDGRDPERVRREASDWFARLRGEPTPEDDRDFAAWRDADPAHAEAYERIAAQWDRTAFLRHTASVQDRNLSRAAVGVGRGRGFPILIGGLAAASIAALVLLFVLTAGFGSSSPPANLAYANPGPAERSVRLSDGSTALLAAGASITAAYTPSERRIALTQGRVRFAVTRDPERRFTVTAGGGSVTARGTIFEMAIENGRVRVRLLEGTVEVRPSSAAPSRAPPPPVVLRPGEETEFDASERESRRPAVVATPSPGAMVLFENTRLDDATAAFAGGLAVQVRPDAAALRISGGFRADDPEGFAAAVAAMFDLRLARQGETLILAAH